MKKRDIGYNHFLSNIKQALGIYGGTEQNGWNQVKCKKDRFCINRPFINSWNKLSSVFLKIFKKSSLEYSKKTANLQMAEKEEKKKIKYTQEPIVGFITKTMEHNREEEGEEPGIEYIKQNGNNTYTDKTETYSKKDNNVEYNMHNFDELLNLSERITKEERQKIDTILNKVDKKKERGFLLELIGINNENDIIEASKACVANCEEIFQRIYKETNIVKIINMIDTASNNICKLGDALELLRNLHSNINICIKANEALQNIEAYIDKINIDPHVYNFLKMNYEKYKHMLNKEHKEVLLNMIKSMETQGIHIQDAQKKKEYLYLQKCEKALAFFISSDDGQSFRKLSKGIYIEKKKLEKYINKKTITEYEKKMAPFFSSKQIPWDPNYSMKKYIYVNNDSGITRIILENVKDEIIRKQVYNLYKQPNEYFLQNILTLHYYRCQLMQYRNFPNYSVYSLSSCILNTPEKVNYFLRKFLEKVLPYFFKELEFIERYIQLVSKREKKLKKKNDAYYENELDTHTIESTKLTPDNLYYYVNQIKKETIKNIEEQMKTHINLYDVIHFVIFLLKNVYSLQMTYIPLQRNELWDNNILKFEITKDQQIYGYIYMDLFMRPNKNNSTAQYTVRCSKNMNMCLKYNWLEQQFEKYPFFYGGIVKSKNENGEVCYRQITSTFLVCNFVLSTDVESIPNSLQEDEEKKKEQKQEQKQEQEYIDGWGHTLLNKKIKHLLKKTKMPIGYIRNFLHEYGHALHCILSSTYLQHLSGNRSGFDFSEFSSHFFENYLSDWNTLSLIYSRCGEEKMKKRMEPLLKEYIKNKNVICYYPLVHFLIQSIIDQIFYTISTDTTSVMERKQLIEEQVAKYFDGIYYKNIFILDLFPQTHFSKTTHLVEYPASYYSYLYCTVLSHYIWTAMFQKQFFNKKKANMLVQFLKQGAVDSTLRSIISMVEKDQSKIDFLTENPHKIPLDQFFEKYEKERIDYNTFLENIKHAL